MNTWKESRSLPPPPRLASLDGNHGPRIPAWARRGGAPVLETCEVDTAHWVHMAQFRLCGMCGFALLKHVALVGTEESLRTRGFRDLALHHDCACYALRVCPALVAPRVAMAMRQEQRQKARKAGAAPFATYQLGSTLALAISSQVEICLLRDGTPGLMAERFSHVSWWRDGQLVSQQSG